MPNLSPEIMDIIKNAATQHGVSPNVLSYIAGIESNGNPNAKNPNSSAKGLFQFMPSTANQYGLSNPYDPIASSDAAARLTRDNYGFLKNKLGREPSEDELYLAHQQGATGAYNLISNPNAKASDIVGVNAISLNRGNPNITSSEFIAQWKRGGSDNSVGKSVPSYSGNGVNPSDQGNTTLASNTSNESKKDNKKPVKDLIYNLLGRQLSGQGPQQASLNLSSGGQQTSQGLKPIEQAQTSSPLQSLVNYLRSV